MDNLFSCKEKGNGYLSLPMSQMDGADAALTGNGAWGSNQEESFGNASELMKFDAYGGWCNSPSILVDHMFPPFALSPLSAASTNFSPFDGFNFTDQYSSGISLVDNNIVESSLVSSDRVIFQQTGSQNPFPTNSASGVELIERIDNNLSHRSVEDEVGNSVIPRSPSQSLAEKMLRALHLFKEWSGGGILAQVWVPVKSGDQYILSTSEQPYLLDETLSGYREVSRSFTFAAESTPGSFPGLPGRVFNSKVPEWTSNVRYYNKAEYLRVQYALHHEVRGSIALPVFDDDSPKRCCAVLELVTVKEKSNFSSEMENVCRALQAVKLKSTIPPRLYPQTLSKHQRAALAEITDVLRAICHAHRLPLALTWIPCGYMEGSGDETIRVRDGGHNMAPNEKSVLCIEDTACYVNDKEMQGFVHACGEHYLEEGQGIVGKAIQSNHPFFYPDVKEHHISEYRLVHHARKFGLNAAVAIRLRSTFTGDNDYILELFLPVDMRGSTEQQLLLNNLSSTMQRICQSLRTVSDAELLGTEYSKIGLQDGEVKNTAPIAPSRTFELLPSGRHSNSFGHETQNVSESTNGEIEPDGLPGKTWAGSRKQVEKKRSTTEKHVSLSVLQQYFSGSLKDAAKSIGVCPTTLKRICRQHGISRWPSRKINKVNRSLRKIQIVLDSVQGVEGSLKFDPAMGGLITSGSIIQDLDSKRTPLSPSKYHSIQNTDLVIQSTNSAPPSSLMNMVPSIVKTEKQWPVDRTDAVGVHFNTTDSFSVERKSNALDSIMKPEALESHLISGSSSPMVAIDEIDMNSISNTWMDQDDGVVEHNQPTSSGMTDSSNGSGSGSMMKGSSSSSRSFGERLHPKTEATRGESGSKITVKATYKEDVIRFKFEPGDGCLQLYEEVGRRFKLHMGHFQLKYLDDEEEWVMLVSDSDLNECMEIMDFIGTRNMKFLVRDMPVSMGSSGSSNCFLNGGFS